MSLPHIVALSCFLLFSTGAKTETLQTLGLAGDWCEPDGARNSFIEVGGQFFVESQSLGQQPARVQIKAFYRLDATLIQITMITGAQATIRVTSTTMRLMELRNPNPAIENGVQYGYPPHDTPTFTHCDASKIASLQNAIAPPKPTQVVSKNQDAPNAVSVNACLEAIYSSKQCVGAVSVRTVNENDRRLGGADASVIADIDVVVRQAFAGCSPRSMNCTGTCWDMDPNKVKSTPSSIPTPGGGENFFKIGQALRVRKTFNFQKWDSGWRCSTNEMAPVEAGFYLKE